MHKMATSASTSGITSAAVNSQAPWTTQAVLLAGRAARNSWRNKLILKVGHGPGARAAAAAAD
jgi:hypothetical protein